ncbi:MAG: pyridoxal phosphate-dependent aminotransferase [Patescibacteria group bacterium]
MEYLKLGQIQQEMKTSPVDWADLAVKRYMNEFKYYSAVITALAKGCGPQMDKTTAELIANQRSNPRNKLSNYAGAYFANEDVIGGSRVPDALLSVNTTYGESGFPTTKDKIKLGPGISFVLPPSFYSDLLRAGANNPELIVNYNAPNGEALTRKGIARIINAKTNLGEPYSEFDGFLTTGATEAIDATMAVFNMTAPGKKVVVLGPSYYAFTYSTGIRDMKVSRLINSGLLTDTDRALNGRTRFLPTIDDLERRLPRNAGLLVLTVPNNPNGEQYSEDELRRIIRLVKKNNALILFDNVFDRLAFQKRKNLIQIAQEEDALDRLIVVESLSKSQNLAGSRPGILATTNPDMRQGLSNMLIAGKCNPPLIYGSLFAFEGLARMVERMQTEDVNISPEKAFNVINDVNLPFDKKWFINAYAEWKKWNDEALRFYKENAQIVRDFLVRTENFRFGSTDEAGFNTIARLREPDLGTSSMDFLTKLLMTTAVYTQVGPCFGLSQKEWDDVLGVWARITYTTSRPELIEGLIRFAAFANTYQEKDMGNSKKFPVLPISYNYQI